MNPEYPVYIISKGRADSRVTSKSLEHMKVPYSIVIEPQEYDAYAAVIDPKKILVLPFSNHGLGSGPARNWCWEHAKSLGYKRHWLMDDNINRFYRLHKGRRIIAESGTMFKVMEDFVDRYENVPLAGLQYTFFCVDGFKYPAFAVNRRIFSCMLIENNAPFRWRGKYNEDVDLSLQVLKAGQCTILFNAFLQMKMATQTVKGGNTEELYGKGKAEAGKGTMDKSQLLVNMHPEHAKIVWRYGRWHHHVDYGTLVHNKLIKRTDIEIPTGVNTYGMKLVERPSWVGINDKPKKTKVTKKKKA